MESGGNILVGKYAVNMSGYIPESKSVWEVTLPSFRAFGISPQTLVTSIDSSRQREEIHDA